MVRTITLNGSPAWRINEEYIEQREEEKSDGGREWEGKKGHPREVGPR